MKFEVAVFCKQLSLKSSLHACMASYFYLHNAVWAEYSVVFLVPSCMELTEANFMRLIACIYCNACSFISWPWPACHQNEK